MTLNTELMFSSKTGKWDTPADLISNLATVFDWDCDVCAERPNVCEFYYSEEQNAFDYPWQGLCWMNPPYGRGIGEWLHKALDETKIQLNTTVVCLVPAITDTRWWQHTVPNASLVVFIRGRLTFGDVNNSAPFPSAFVVFGELTKEQEDKLSSYGWSVKNETR